MKFTFLSGLLLTAAIPYIAHAGEPFLVIGWGDGRIIQGMSREDVVEILRSKGLELVDRPAFGPTFVEGGRSYSLSFCDGVLTSASWTFDDNGQFLRSLNQRVNKDGFAIVQTNVEGFYDDRRNNELTALTLHLENKRDPAPYYITYNVFESNAQVTLRDSRYGFSCKRRA